MHSPGSQHGRVKTGSTGWVSIRINESDGLPSLTAGSAEKQTIPPSLVHLFDYAEAAPLPLPERFPRLTFVGIAIALLVTALTAEFDYLRSAGYFWP